MLSETRFYPACRRMIQSVKIWARNGELSKQALSLRSPPEIQSVCALGASARLGTLASRSSTCSQPSLDYIRTAGKQNPAREGQRPFFLFL